MKTYREIETQAEPSRTESKDTLDSYDQAKDMGADDAKTESEDIKSGITKLESPPDKVEEEKKNESEFNFLGKYLK